MKLIVKKLPPEQNVYNRAIIFLYGSVADINARLKRECGEHWDAELCTVTDCMMGRWLIAEEDGYESDFICLVRRADRSHEPATLAHEVLHHCGHALRSAGLPHTEETEEAYCYYLGWVMLQCLSAIPKR